MIFSCGYKCCVFKHNIYEDRSKVPEAMPDSADPLPPEFFVNPGFPPLSKRLPKPVEIAVVEDHVKL